MRAGEEQRIYKELAAYKSQMSVIAREEEILKTIYKSKEVFTLCEQKQTINYFEFILGQLRLIRKRWWLLQALLLGFTSILLPYMQNTLYMVRTLGVMGILFVVLIIPEFWKNKSHDSMQVEGTCLYSLRQIYAVRMLLFGMVDMLILTCFCIAVRGNAGLAAAEIFVQFLFPMLVAACICFGTLCAKTAVNERTAVLLCLLWSAVWCVVIINKTVYAAITFPAWCALFGIAVLFLTVAAGLTLTDEEIGRCAERVRI